MSYQRMGSGDDVESIGVQLQNFTMKVNTFKKFCSKVGQPSAPPDLMSEVSKLRGELISTSKRIATDLHQCRPSADKRGKLAKIKTEFESTLKVFQQQSNLLLEKEKKVLSEEEDRVSVSSKMSLEERQSLAFQNVAQLNEEDLKKRQDEINLIEKDMVIVNNMFKDVAAMVVQQGDMLNQAENHVENAEKETGEAVNELKKAERYQSKARKKMCYILIIVFIVVVVLVLIVLGATGSL